MFKPCLLIFFDIVGIRIIPQKIDILGIRSIPHDLKSITQEATLKNNRMEPAQAVYLHKGNILSGYNVTLIKLSRTMSRRSDTWPMLPQILACMEGYISSSSIVIVISLSRISATF